MPLDFLSQAERRWAHFAINLTLRIGQEPLVFLDEPESALHRSAEAHLALNLQNVAASLDVNVVCATHSPELLNAPDCHTFAVRRADQRQAGEGSIEELAAPSRQELEDLGLLPSDLLRRQRGFLIVEGEHDLAVLEETIGLQLKRLRVEILPLRGAGQLKTLVDSRVLYDFTDAHIFVMLDALDSHRIQSAWSRALSEAKTRPLDAVIAELVADVVDPTINESGMLAGFLTRALQRDLGERVTPVTLMRLDILDYLPVREFVPSAESWAGLRHELADALGREPSGREFKQWLSDIQGARLDDAHLRSAARGLPSPPAEFQRHVDVIEATLRSGRG